VREHQADIGLAWDGDYDRCFFFDEHGQFVDGYYLVGLLAAITPRDRPGAASVHDPRLTWNTIDIVKQAGGRAVMNKTGHAFMKERMRVEDAAYGGEMSAHHYFRQFAYCDSGMLPWLLVLQEISTSGKSLSQLVAAMQRAYPVSGEINRRLPNPAAASRTRRSGLCGRCGRGRSHRRSLVGHAPLAFQRTPEQHRTGRSVERRVAG